MNFSSEVRGIKSLAEIIGEGDGGCRGEFGEKGRVLRKPLGEMRGLTEQNYVEEL